jgi:hypothetical protein
MKKYFFFSLGVFTPLIFLGCQKAPSEELQTFPTPPVRNIETEKPLPSESMVEKILEKEDTKNKAVPPSLSEKVEEIKTEKIETEKMGSEEFGTDELLEETLPQAQNLESDRISQETEATQYQSAETCREDGGSWLRGQDANHTQICLKPYSDAGISCENPSDCQGRCLAQFNEETSQNEGRCQKNNNPFGCFVEMKDGEMQEEVCVE